MDILNQVEFSERAVVAYYTFCERLGHIVISMGINPDEMPDEEARLGEDGTLIIYLDLPREQGRVEVSIPAGEWAWRNRN